MGLDQLSASIVKSSASYQNDIKSVAVYDKNNNNNENDITHDDIIEDANEDISVHSHSQHDQNVTTTHATKKDKKRKQTNSESEDDVLSDPQEMDTYRPVQGEDIYGRTSDKDNSNNTTHTKYIPPSKRLLMNSVDMVCICICYTHMKVHDFFL